MIGRRAAAIAFRVMPYLAVLRARFDGDRSCAVGGCWQARTGWAGQSGGLIIGGRQFGAAAGDAALVHSLAEVGIEASKDGGG